MPASQSLRFRLTTASGPNPFAVAAVVCLGLAVLAHPFVLFPHFGQTPYGMVSVEAVDAGAVEEGSIVDYADLPAAAKESFDGAGRGEYRTLWTGDDERALATLQAHQYVQKNGRYYEYSLVHGDRSQLVPLVVRLLLTVVGSVLVTLGALVAVTGTWRPLTPLRTPLIVAAVLLGLSGMHAYDVVVSGAGGSIRPPLVPFGVVSLPVAALAVGSLVRLRGHGILKAVVAVGVAALAAGTVVLGEPVVAPLALAAYVAVAGAPSLALGYWLTDDEATEM